MSLHPLFAEIFASHGMPQGERMSEFQPPDLAEQDPDDLWDAWFAQQERNGMAVISREDWRNKLDEAARDGYAEGRKDERESFLPALRHVRLALKEAELLLASVYDFHGLASIDAGGMWVNTKLAADRMEKAIEALDDAAGAI